MRDKVVRICAAFVTTCWLGSSQWSRRAAVAKLGKRARLKSSCPKGLVGSIPTRRIRGTDVRSRAEVDLVLRMAAEGENHCQISRETGIPRKTVQMWASGRTPRRQRQATCLRCGPDRYAYLPHAARAYAYLLGLYLGDGCLLRHPRVHRLN